MGHNRLGRLSRAQPWREVVELLRSGEGVSDIADATMLAAARGLEKIGHDPGFVHTLTTIFKFVEAASSKDFEGELKKNGFAVPTGASFFDVIGSFRERLDADLSQQRTRSDVAEIAQNAFSETLVKYVLSDSPSLFAETADSVQNSLKKHLTGKSFKALMHEFFSSLTSRYLSYYISREVSNFVGPGSSLANIDAHRRFDQAFDLYVRQSIRIADEFTPGWIGKAIHVGDTGADAVRRYAHAAFKKIRSEFRRGAEVTANDTFLIECSTVKPQADDGDAHGWNQHTMFPSSWHADQSPHEYVGFNDSLIPAPDTFQWFSPS